ncbi:MAG: FtsH protease activity modulator HflK [Deltaproteobacteria bacterium]|nr:FtsH protease activity modulator HflK [Deltaproteobacteria bacterium]
MAGYGEPQKGDEFVDLGKKIGQEVMKRMRWIPLLLILVIAALTTYYQIEPDEVGLVMRFGKYIRTSEPGPHFRLPFGIEQVSKVPVQRQLKAEFGVRTQSTGSDPTFSHARRNDTAAESTMLTADTNVANVKWTVQYKVSDPYKYLFRVKRPRTTFNDMNEAIMRKVVGDYSVTELLKSKREEILTLVKEELQALCDRYEIGIGIQLVNFEDVNPPEPVRDAFNEVNRAEQEKATARNIAQAKKNSVIPEAAGKARQAILAAEGYAVERRNQALGEVARFVALQKEYAKAPRVTRTRIYLETLSKVLPNAGKRIILDGNLKGLLPLLNLGGAK